MSDLLNDPELRELFAPLLSELYAVSYKGEAIRFDLKRGEHLYNYYQGSSGRLFCYTPHPSTKGFYFVWTYVPKGKGSRSGSAREYTLRDLVKCSKRKTARSKAISRYYKDIGKGKEK
jgi:hypothetical protein